MVCLSLPRQVWPELATTKGFQGNRLWFPQGRLYYCKPFFLNCSHYCDWLFLLPFRFVPIEISFVAPWGGWGFIEWHLYKHNRMDSLGGICFLACKSLNISIWFPWLFCNGICFDEQRSSEVQAELACTIHTTGDASWSLWSSVFLSSQL